MSAGQFTSISAEPIATGIYKLIHRATYVGRAGFLPANTAVALTYFRSDISPALNDFGATVSIEAPHLAKFFGVVPLSKVGFPLCVVAELAAFGALPKFLDQKGVTLSLDHMQTMALQAGQGLAALNGQRIVHGDVGAANVLVFAFDEKHASKTLVKLSGFGMVRAAARIVVLDGPEASMDHVLLPADGALPLSVAHSAPESLRNQIFYYASDVWSFAVLTWQLLTGCKKALYPDVVTCDSMLQHLAAGHRLSCPPTCPPRLYTLLLQCWREKRSERPSLREVLAEIGHIQEVTQLEQATAAERLKLQEWKTRAAREQQLMEEERAASALSAWRELQMCKALTAREKQRMQEEQAASARSAQFELEKWKAMTAREQRRAEEAQAASAAAEDRLRRLQTAQQSWCKPGFEWWTGGIALTSALDNELQYVSKNGAAWANVRQWSDRPHACRLARAVEELIAANSERSTLQVQLESLTLCKNQSLITSFNERLARLHTQKVSASSYSVFGGKWSPGPDDAEKQRLYSRLQRLFVHTSMTGGTKVALMWHGAQSDAAADVILQTGISSCVNSGDSGFFGHGVYLTPEAAYAAFYSNKAPFVRPARGTTCTLVLCAVCLVNPYPLTRGADYAPDSEISYYHFNHDTDDVGKALKAGFDAHFVGVTPGYQAAPRVADAIYHELVVRDEQQVLPFAKLVVRVK